MRNPGAAFVLETVEVRWILPGEPPQAVMEWIAEKATAEASGERTDVYLAIRGAAHTGIKLREGRLEVKTRTHVVAPNPSGRSDGSDPSAPTPDAGPSQVPGEIEHWTKWSQPVPLSANDMGLAGGEAGPVRTERVLKRRLAFFEDNVLTEVTVLERLGEPWWTVGLEGMVSEQDLHRAVQPLMAVPELARLLIRENAMSYPEWLLRMGQRPAGTTSGRSGS